MHTSSSPAAQRRRAALVSLVLTGGMLTASVVAAGDASASPTAGATTAPALAADRQGGSFVLHVGVSVYSPDHTHRLVVADYGDLLLLGPGGAVVWHTETSGESDASLALLDDGNLVLRSQGGRLMWQSGTNGYGASTMAVTDDGRVVLTAARGVSWTSAGLVARPHGGVSQSDPLGQDIATWAAGQEFASRNGCNPYSFRVGVRSVGCPSGQARRAWNWDFVEAAEKSAGATHQDQRCFPVSPRCTPQPGDEAVFQVPSSDLRTLTAVVTEVNTSTRMMRLAFGDVDGAVLHVWLPVQGAVVDGRPLYRVGAPTVG